MVPTRPTLSVCMAVRNEERVIGDQLAALAGQESAPEWELVVVDNGSTDGTLAVLAQWAGRLPLHVLAGPARSAPAASRNLAWRSASASALAFCDADDVVGPRWVATMAEGLADHEHVTGPLEMRRLNPPGTVRGDHIERWLHRPPGLVFMRYSMGCNMGFTRLALEAVGGFDESLPSGDDKDVSWRVQLAGHALVFLPEAVVHRRVRPGGRLLARQQYRYGVSNARLHRRYRGQGARRSSVVEAVAVWAWLATAWPGAVVPMVRRRWIERLALRWGRLVGSIRYRVLYL